MYNPLGKVVLDKVKLLPPEERFYYWISERYKIFTKKQAGENPPWTNDPILRKYKFTNPFREDDRTTVWMRQNWTIPNAHRPHSEILFNCCLFRMIGTMEFAEAHGWVYDTWDSEATKELIEDRISKGLKTFTGAYMISNQGLIYSKSRVVVDFFLKPVWKDREKFIDNIKEFNSLQALHNFFKPYRGWKGSGFMAYEVVTDLNHTPLLQHAKDRYTWANAGPGAERGLNRLHRRPFIEKISQEQANKEMNILQSQALISLADSTLSVFQELTEVQPITSLVDMRCIEHSLCEWDKYERVLWNQGTPRSVYKYEGDV